MPDYYRNIERVPEQDVAELVGRIVRLESLERGVSVVRNNFKTVLETILVASIFLLLAVCLTVGGLLTIRAVSRRLEFAIRYSLGASRLGLLRQLWIEGLLFAGAGGALGVASVAVMRGRGVAWTVAPAGETITPSHVLATMGNTVSADYVETMGMRVVEGRSFRTSDQDTLLPDRVVPALVNQAFATRFFPNGSPLGKYFGPPTNGLGSSRYVIVGVVSDAKYRSLREPVPLTFFALGWPPGTFVLNVRTSSPPRMILEPVQKVLASINPSLSFREVHTLDAEVNASIANERLMAVVVSTFAICAALAAVAGIYGLTAYLAALRRREIAIRMALGATGVNIVQLMTSESLIVVFAGIVIGLAASRVFASMLQPMLFNTSATSPVTALVTAAVVLVVTCVATAAPIVRVARVAPAQVLRE